MSALGTIISTGINASEAAALADARNINQTTIDEQKAGLFLRDIYILIREAAEKHSKYEVEVKFTYNARPTLNQFTLICVTLEKQGYEVDLRTEKRPDGDSFLTIKYEKAKNLGK